MIGGEGGGESSKELTFSSWLSSPVGARFRGDVGCKTCYRSADVDVYTNGSDKYASIIALNVSDRDMEYWFPSPFSCCFVTAHVVSQSLPHLLFPPSLSSLCCDQSGGGISSRRPRGK